MRIKPDMQAQLGNLPDEATIRKAYQLDTLEPTTWVDYNDVRHSRTLPVIVAGHVRNGDERPSGRGGGVERGDIWAVDDEDPLGLKPSVFGSFVEGKNYSQTKPTLKAQEFQFCISSKGFNPRQFLQNVHKQTSFPDLVASVDHLKDTLAQKSEALKMLVQNNFDRFVSAKTTIDRLYEEMRGHGWVEENDYGLRCLENALSDTTQITDQIFGPVFMNGTTIAKIQNILIILERFRFLLGMPSNMRRFLKRRKYEYVIKDYKKSKVMLEATIASETSSDTSSNIDTSEDEETLKFYHQIVFDKLSTEIENIMEEMRDQLLRQLSEPWRSIQEQEETMNLLAELDTDINPVWPYLNSQYKYILETLSGTFKKHTKRIDVLKRAVPEQPASENDIITDLRHSIHLVEIQDMDSLPGSRNPDIMVWSEILNLVKALSDLVVHHLPDFWKLIKSFVDGKFKKNPVMLSNTKRHHQAMDLDSVGQCRKMAKRIVDLYAAILTGFFELGPPPNDSATTLVPPKKAVFVPPHSNSLVISYFLTKIVSEISDCVNIINVINMTSDAFGALSTLMERMRWQFADIICEAWSNDVETFYKLEDWTVVHENRHITMFLRNFRLFVRHNSRSAYRIASLGFVAERDEHKPEKPAVSSIPDDLVMKIKNTFVDSLYSFFDGLVHLAFSAYSPEKVSDNQPNELISLSRLNAKKLDIRVLMTISNLSYLKKSMIPKLVHQFEQTYKCSLTNEFIKLNKAIDERDTILFDNYIKRKTAILHNIITWGILRSGFDWYEVSRPKEVHGFVHEALLCLVLVHAQVRDISRHLVERILRALIENLANEYLSTFQRVKTFGIGGMLQATLDVEFTQLALAKYVSSSAKNVINKVYVIVDQQCDKNKHAGNLQYEAQRVKKLLVTSAKSTSLQFACFRKPE